MKQIYTDLWQTELEIPFGSVHAHAYFLKTEKSQVLIYNTGHQEEIEEIADEGGINYQLLSHRDEAGDSLKIIKQKFGSKLCCHKLEVPAISQSCPVDIVFSENISQVDGLEVIYTPGHTEGSISFIYRSPIGHTYLFTGDTLFQTNGQWQTLTFSSAGGSPEALIESLLIYRNLNPDVVLWSASGGGEISFIETTSDQWTEDIDSMIKQLKT